MIMAVHTQLKQLRKESLENNSGLKEIEQDCLFFLLLNGSHFVVML